MARTSPYGDLLQVPGMKIPDWVFGSDFGDMENDIIKTEFARRQSEGQALQNDTREMQLEAAQRELDYENQLSGVFQEKKPTTVRDMYQVAMEQALGAGRAEDFMKMQTGLEQLDRQEKQQKIQDINTAIAAGRINPGMAAQMMPDLFTPDVVKRQQERNNLMGGLMYDPESGELVPKPRAGGAGGVRGGESDGDFGKGSITLVNPQTGAMKMVPKSQANAHFELGWVPEDSPMALQAMAERMNPKEQDSGESFLSKIFRAEPPPVPSAEAQMGGGARAQAASTPPPGAVVQQVIRRRTQENKGR